MATKHQASAILGDEVTLKSEAIGLLYQGRRVHLNTGISGDAPMDICAVALGHLNAGMVL